MAQSTSKAAVFNCAFPLVCGLAAGWNVALKVMLRKVRSVSSPDQRVCLAEINLLCKSRAAKKSSQVLRACLGEGEQAYGGPGRDGWGCRKDAKVETENQSGKKPERLRFALVGLVCFLFFFLKLLVRSLLIVSLQNLNFQ